MVGVPLHCSHSKVNSTSEWQYLHGLSSMDKIGIGMLAYHAYLINRHGKIGVPLPCLRFKVNFTSVCH